MTVIASRSSTTARVSRKVRNAVGRCVDSTASTARANAMSVAIGTAQPSMFSGWPASTLIADVDRGGHDHAADGGRDRQGCAARITQIPGHEFALEFEPDDEEEDGQQSVGGPRRDAELQMQRRPARSRTPTSRGTSATTASSPTPGPRLRPPVAAPRRPSPYAGSRKTVATPTTSRASGVASVPALADPRGRNGVRDCGGTFRNRCAGKSGRQSMTRP